MQIHQEHILEAARQGIKPTRDTIIMLDDIHNIAKKRA
jgi:replication-associated recombination protein RarA